MQTINSLAGHLLIAMPKLDDPFFSRSVTYICEHNQDGALGILLNKPLEATYQELFDHLNMEYTDISSCQKQLLAGGPVDRERGFILHQPIGQWQSSLIINQDIALSTSEDILSAISNNSGPEKVLIALGYSGWQKGQLEQEIEENSWLLLKAAPDIVFDISPDLLWQKATQLLGIDWTQISGQSGHA